MCFRTAVSCFSSLESRFSRLCSMSSACCWLSPSERMISLREKPGYWLPINDPSKKLNMNEMDVILIDEKESIPGITQPPMLRFIYVWPRFAMDLSICSLLPFWEPCIQNWNFAGCVLINCVCVSLNGFLVNVKSFWTNGIACICTQGVFVGHGSLVAGWGVWKSWTLCKNTDIAIRTVKTAWKQNLSSSCVVIFSFCFVSRTGKRNDTNATSHRGLCPARNPKSSDLPTARSCLLFVFGQCFVWCYLG